MTKLLIIGLGGFLGAIARYSLSGLVHQHMNSSFPYGTLAVNVLGCFLIGAGYYFVEDRAVMSPQMRLFLFIGLLGAFTTFSTFGYETNELIRDKKLFLALVNAAGNLVLGVFAVWLGRTLLRALGI